MANYTKVYDGAAKDAAEDTIEGADFDTEYDAIATAIATKADKVSGGTSGNLLEQDANGNLVDSGISSANLDGLTGVVQTQIDSKVDLVTAPTGHIRAGNFHIMDGGTNKTAFVVDTTVAHQTWESIGPTGSGADNIWDQMDDMDSSARMLYVVAEYECTNATAGASFGFGNVFCVSGDVASPTTDQRSQVLRWYFEFAAQNEQSAIMVPAIIPVNSSQVFKLYWSESTGEVATIKLHYRGFITD